MFKLFVTFVFVVLTAEALSPPYYPQQVIRILRQQQEIDPSGSYRWSYDTENGISAQEQGTVRQISPKESALSAQGSYSYTSPEGIPVGISYIADDNGYQPQGNVLPTSPPIPNAILRSIEYNRARPELQRPRYPF